MKFFLNTREASILDIIYTSEFPVNITEICSRLNISKRCVFYDFKAINYWLDENRVGHIMHQRGVGYFLNEQQKEKLHSALKDFGRLEYYQFLRHERVNIILCALLGLDGILTIDVFMDYCQVSRNTIISDLSFAKEEFEKYGLSLESSKGKGYYVIGDIIKKRSLFLYLFQDIKYLYDKDLIRFIDKKIVKAYLFLLNKIESNLNIVYVEGVLLSLAVLLSIIPSVESDFKLLSDINIEQIKKTNEFKTVQKYLGDFPLFEQIYITLHFLGSRVQLSRNPVETNAEDLELMNVCRHLVSDFENIACVRFENIDEVTNALFIHLKSSIYRYRYGIEIGNPLTEMIKEKYEHLFTITKLASASLAKYGGNASSDHEVAYLTIIFGSFMQSSKYIRKPIKILVLNSEGRTLERLLKNELEILIPNAAITFEADIHQVLDKIEYFHAVLSTSKLDTDIDYIKINSILSKQDHLAIMNKLSHYTFYDNHKFLLDSFLGVTDKFVSQDVSMQIRQYIDHNIHDNLSFKKTEEEKVPGILDVLSVDNIVFVEDIIPWNDSISITARPLLHKQYIEAAYVSQMIETVIENGPYIYFSPGVAIAHAGSNRQQILSMSMGIFKNQVVFGKDLYVQVVICLAPINYQSHLRIIKEINDFFEDEANYHKVIAMNDAEEVLDLIKEKLAPETQD